MLRTLNGRLALALLALLALLGALLFGVNLVSTRRFLQEISQGLQRDLAAQLVRESLPLADGEVQEEALERIFHTLMVVNPAIEVYLLDAGGGILAYSAPPGSVQREAVSLAPVRRFLEGAEPLPVLGDDPRDAEGAKVFSVAPIGPEDPPEGYLYVILASEQYDSAVAMIRGSHMIRLGLGATAAALVFALASGLLLFALITRRVRRLAAAVDRFKESSFTEPIRLGWDEPRRGDEIHTLGATFEEMGDRMRAQLEELKKTDLLRRELVANVSHDLRTPLTSLHGYLETLSVKADALSEEERREYLEIALKHSERLGQLASSLFELAKLESGTTELKTERFTLAELVQDAVQHFGLEAEEKDVRLSAQLPDEPHQVRADVGLVARVLDNLLDNALRHTPSGGKVTVAVDRRREKLRVRVEDTGPGISPEHLPHLFERFFHHPAGERDDSGLGLGLAIARKAVELHGGELEVESRPGHGACFAFELRIAPPDVS